MPHWVIFHVPTPTPDGQTAQDLYDKRVRWFTPEMKESAREHGCRFHRAWTAKDGSAFWAIACWETREGGQAFYEQGTFATSRVRRRSTSRATSGSFLSRSRRLRASRS